MKTLSILFVLLASTSCSSMSGTRGAAPAEFVPVQGNDAVLVYSGGCDSWFADAKDQKLKQTLELVDARVAELATELQQPTFPAPAIRWLLQMMRHPMDLRVGLIDGSTQPTMPFRAQITVQAEPADAARAMAESFATILAGYGVPSLGKNESMHGLSMIPLGEFSAYHGAPDDGSHGTFVIAANEVVMEPAQLGSLDLPAGVQPCFAYKVDYGEIARLNELDGPSATQNPMIAAMQGVIVQGGVGFGSDRMYGGMRQRGWHASMEHMGILPSGPLKESEIAMIPRDATWAILGRMKLSGLSTMLREMFASRPELGGMDPFAALAAYTGFDFDKELLQYLGETWGVYASDSTGGGGLTSTVMFQSITNSAGLEKSLDWMCSELGAFSESHAHGYVRLEKQSGGERARWMLTFPGVPVPVEAVIELAHGYLFAGLSPQAVDAAVRQASNSDTSLLDQPHFRDVASGSMDDLYSLSFSDTPRLARDGYAVTNMLCASLSNATRSKVDRERGAGAILPAYHDLLRDAKAMVALGRLDGEDLVVTLQGDHSVLVNACSVVGQYQSLAALVGLGGAIAAQHRRELAEQAEHMQGAEATDPANMQPDEDMDQDMDTDELMDDADSADEMHEDDVEETPEPR